MTAADRFRTAAEQRDTEAMAAALAPGVVLRSPTSWPAVEGRDRARMMFGVLERLFEDFEYTHVLEGAPAGEKQGITSSHVLAFRCRVGGETIEGVDLLDLDDNDEIAVFTVFVRPLPGLQALADAIAMRLAGGGARTD
jgi:hypothetical protein